MNEYLFVLGRTSDLCQGELKAVLKVQKIDYRLLFSSTEVFHFETPSNLNTDDLIKTLGGTIKIAKVFTTLQIVDQEKITEGAIRILKQVQNDVVKKTLNFGFSGYGEIHFNDRSKAFLRINHCSVEVKDNLEKENLKSRFILPKGELSLSSVVIKKQHLTEIILSKEKEKLILAKTLAIQDFEDWGKRDFGRPCADARSGMLPPKVARMMINLGLLGLPIQDRNKNVATILDRKVVLDPFCGVGTILGEGLMMGYEVIGTDTSEAAVQKSQKNLEWLVSKFKVQGSRFKVLQMDATHVSEKIPAGSIDAIVTEPYLGPSDVMLNLFQHPQRILNQVQNDERHKLGNIITGLDKLYLGCLREWRKILKPGGVVVMAFPSFKSPAFAKASAGKEFFVKKALDSCENLGYTLEAGPYQYSRPQAVVKRNIYRLRFDGRR